MGNSASGLLGALSFLTRVPARGVVANAVPWFPLIGGAIGLVLATVYALAAEILPSLVASSIAVVTGVLLTGALHEDGLADTVDALGASDRARRIEILKDPRLGTFGGLALGSSLLVRVGAVAGMDAATAVAILPAAHALGRAAAVGLIATIPVAREGVGASYARSVSRRGTVWAILTGIAVAALSAGLWALAALAVATAGAALVGRVAIRAFGGVTGDLLGAGEQVVETAVLLLGAAIATNGWMDAAWWH